ncbi:ovalbumin-related protein X-like isoform X2 [Nylanderia fulva]|nr:ovalbumin-related protein X-like isoform X2 [Nylanderia fulva]
MFKKTALYVIIISSTIFHTLAMSSSDNKSITLFTASNNFINQLYRNLSANTDENIIISPLSLQIILTLLSHGAAESTLNELRSVLDDTEFLTGEYKALLAQLNNINKATLYLRNAAYVQEEVDIEGDFLSVCMNIFESLISKVDFGEPSTVDIINSWILTATNHKIRNVISAKDIDNDTRFLLLNAIYFQCAWQKMFNENDTTPRWFHDSQTSYMVPTMYKKATYFHGEIPTMHTQFIEIPYLNENIVMVILLPYKEAELKDVEKNFNWETVVNAHRSSNHFNLYLPKFEFENTINLNDVLNKIGLKTMFLKKSANFTRISSDLSLSVSTVLQKVFIKFDERGSEAAGVTGVEVRLKRSAISPVDLFVDRSFMFAIEHKPTKLPLFLGSVRELRTYIKDEL